MISPRLVVLACGLLGPIPAWAVWFDEPPLEADPSALLEAARQADPTQLDSEGDLSLLFATERTIAASTALRVETHTVFVIGETTKSLQFPTSWNPVWQDRPELRARLIHPDGSVTPLTPSIVEDQIAKTANQVDVDFQRRQVTRFGSVQPGDIVETLAIVTVREGMPAANSGEISLLQTFPCAHVRVAIRAEAPIALRWHADDAGGVLQELRDGAWHGFVYDVDHAPSRPALGFLPGTSRSAPTVRFTTEASWKELGAEYARFVAAAVQPLGLEAWSTPILAGPSDPRARIEAALTTVREDVAWIEAGSVVGMRPRPPADVLRSGNGDSKDRAAVLVALLASVGIDARLALLRSGWGQDVDERFPTLAGVDTAIVYVPSLDLWIDPKPAVAPPGRLAGGAYDRWVLVLTPDSGSLQRTPVARADEHTAVERTTVRLGAAEASESRVSLERSGWPVDLLHDELRRGEPEATSRILTAIAGKATFGTAGNPEVVTGPDGTWRASIAVQGSWLGRADARSGSATLDPAPVSQMLPSWLKTAPTGEDALARRGEPVALPPFVSVEAFRIEVPPLFEPSELPEVRDERWGPVALTTTVATSPGTVEVTWTLRCDGGDLAPDEAVRLRDALATLAEITVSFDNVLFRRLETDPAAAFALLREAEREGLGAFEAAEIEVTALLDLRLGDLASRRAARVAEAHPDAAAAWSILGNALLHDSIGRYLGGDYDRDGAIAALERALAIEPARWVDEFRLAGVLRSGVGGDHGEGAQPAASVRVLRAGPELRFARADVWLAEDLIASGRAAEVVALEFRHASVPQADALRAAARLVVGDHKTAAALAGQLDGHIPEHAEAVSGAVRLLWRLRDYEEADSLLALTGTPSPLASRDPSGPTLGFRRWETFRGTPAAEATVRLLAALGGADGDLGRISAADLDGAPIPGHLEWSFPPNVRVDLVVGSAELVEARAGRSRRRVTVLVPGEYPFVVYTERSGKTTQVVAISGMATRIARTAWEFSRAGDTRHARQWLRWALEDRREDPEVVAELSSQQVRQLAAAVMLPDYLEDAREDVRALASDASRPEVASTARHALAWYHDQRGEPDLALEWANGDAAGDAAWRDHAVPWILAGAGRHEVLLARAPETGTEAWARTRQSGALASVGLYEAAADAVCPPVPGREPTPRERNSCAWSLLFFAEPQAAVDASPDLRTRDVAALHTRGAALALAGDLPGASATLERLDGLLGRDDTVPDTWWLVIGAMEARLGYPEDAIEALGRVEASDGADSTWVLAQREIARIREQPR